MAIEIRNEKHISRPVIICDHCGKEISKGDDGNYAFSMDSKRSGVIFLHKRCSWAEEYRPLGMIEIPWLLVYLKNNLEVDVEKTENHILNFSSF